MKKWNEIILEENDYKAIVVQFVSNPYGIGANAAEQKDGGVTFRFLDSYSRDKAITKLKGLGVPANKISKATQPSGYKYRSECYVSFS